MTLCVILFVWQCPVQLEATLLLKLCKRLSVTIWFEFSRFPLFPKMNTSRHWTSAVKLRTDMKTDHFDSSGRCQSENDSLFSAYGRLIHSSLCDGLGLLLFFKRKLVLQGQNCRSTPLLFALASYFQCRFSLTQ